VLVLAFAGTLLWGMYAFRSYRRHEKMYERHKIELERLRADEASSSFQARANAARIEVIVANASDGIALFDSSLRLIQWNYPFARGLGVALQVGMPLDAVMRNQLRRQEPAISDMDLEAEVARHISILCGGDAAGLKQRSPDGEDLILRGLSAEVGGFVLLLNGFTTWQPVPLRGPALLPDLPAAPAAPVVVPIDW
jgi:PAS domain-containing protein